MRVVDIIRQKRDGGALDRDAVDQFVRGTTDDSWADYQLSAMLMAIVLKGMTKQETAWLTDAMARSGSQLSFRDLGKPVVDKHSTGGVGDKISLALAPLAAACGLLVPMMSGRGLGHTGGTIDKLESIPGFRAGLTQDEMRRALVNVGCCITAPTKQVAPADGRLYGLRDVTATVDSIPLITASILSKKLAEGLDGLVMDVKVGRGAFMKTESDARALGESLVGVGHQLGLRVEALLTNMDAPLGAAIGNALEVKEAIDILARRGPADVTELSIAFASRMVTLGGLEADSDAATARVHSALDSGAALERLRLMVAQQGGDARVVDDPRRLEIARQQHVVCADRDGFLCALDAELLGTAAVALGAGRTRVEDAVDPAVGVVVHHPVGATVHHGEPVLTLYHRDGRGLPDAIAQAVQAIAVGDSMPGDTRLILCEIK